MASRSLGTRIRGRWNLYREYAFYLRHFRNGLELIQNIRQRKPSDQAVLRDGTVLRHPANRHGLTETLTEVWHGACYTGSFYKPLPGDVVLDAGANVGLTAILLSRLQPGLRIHSFEPFRENYEFLCANLKAAGAGNVTAYHAALGGTSGRGSMAALGDRSLDHQLLKDTGDSVSEFPVYSFAEAMTFADSPRVALFKIDIEGSEYDLFENADAALIARVDRFVVEYHDNLRPGALKMVTERLEPTHRLTVEPSDGCDCGILYAMRAI